MVDISVNEDASNGRLLESLSEIRKVDQLLKPIADCYHLWKKRSKGDEKHPAHPEYRSLAPSTHVGLSIMKQIIGRMEKTMNNKKTQISDFFNREDLSILRSRYTGYRSIVLPRKKEDYGLRESEFADFNKLKRGLEIKLKKKDSIDYIKKFCITQERSDERKTAAESSTSLLPTPIFLVCQQVLRMVWHMAYRKLKVPDESKRNICD